MREKSSRAWHRLAVGEPSMAYQFLLLHRRRGRSMNFITWPQDPLAGRRDAKTDPALPFPQYCFLWPLQVNCGLLCSLHHNTSIFGSSFRILLQIYGHEFTLSTSLPGIHSSPGRPYARRAINSFHGPFHSATDQTPPRQRSQTSETLISHPATLYSNISA